MVRQCLLVLLLVCIIFHSTKIYGNEKKRKREKEERERKEMGQTLSTLRTMVLLAF